MVMYNTFWVNINILVGHAFENGKKRGGGKKCLKDLEHFNFS